VKTEQLRGPDLDGVFGCPAADGSVCGVLALGGSDGGVPEYLLRLLVPEGFACLALAYFGTPSTQPALTEVPLKRIERGLHWLRDHPRVKALDGRLSSIGASKGGELALLAAAMLPDLVGATVAYTPSSVVWQGIDFRSPQPPMLSSWSVDAGHTLLPSDSRTAPPTMPFDLGGDPTADNHAHATAWPEVVGHLRYD